jgi:hypothetical protein
MTTGLLCILVGIALLGVHVIARQSAHRRGYRRGFRRAHMLCHRNAAAPDRFIDLDGNQAPCSAYSCHCAQIERGWRRS